MAKEEFKTTGEPLQEESKLGTTVTYTNPRRKGAPTSVGGVPMREGQSVDLAKFLPEDQAKTLAKKLSGNRFFQVQGGPKHEEQAESRDNMFMAGGVMPQVLAAEQNARLRGEEPPEGYDAPLEPVLEGSKRPNLPKGK
jgi:hypothetical protein